MCGGLADLRRIQRLNPCPKSRSGRTSTSRSKDMPCCCYLTISAKWQALKSSVGLPRGGVLRASLDNSPSKKISCQKGSKRRRSAQAISKYFQVRLASGWTWSILQWSQIGGRLLIWAAQLWEELGCTTCRAPQEERKANGQEEGRIVKHDDAFAHSPVSSYDCCLPN